MKKLERSIIAIVIGIIVYFFLFVLVIFVCDREPKVPNIIIELLLITLIVSFVTASVAYEHKYLISIVTSLIPYAVAILSMLNNPIVLGNTLSRGLVIFSIIISIFVVILVSACGACLSNIIFKKGNNDGDRSDL